MSKKAKYSVITTETIDSFEIAVMSAGRNAAVCYSLRMARKIARALNAMEAKPKAKPFAFDWSLAELRFNFSAMDFDGQWYLFETKPHVNDNEVWAFGGNFREIRGIKTYPGDWRDSLQERP